MMKYIRSTIAILIIAASVDPGVSTHDMVRSRQLEQCKTVETVDDFNIRQYASKPWYVHQQAENTYSPRSRNYCVRAEYTPLARNTFWGYSIGVDNRASDASKQAQFGGDLCAYQTDESKSKLAVAPCFLPKALAGPYWVVAYSEREGYALISGGQPKFPGKDGGCRTGSGINNSGLWIFSRSPERDDDLVDKVREIAVNAGFDVSVLNDVDQAGCEYD